MSLCHSVFCSSVTMSLHTLSLMSFWLPFLCYHVFTYSVPSVILASVPLLPCLLHTLSIMSFCLPFLCYHVFTYSVPYVFMSFWLINVKYFHHLPILSVTCEWQVGQYLPFLSRTFRDEFVSIKNTIVYKIKQRRQKSENRKFIY